MPVHPRESLIPQSEQTDYIYKVFFTTKRATLSYVGKESKRGTACRWVTTCPMEVPKAGRNLLSWLCYIGGLKIWTANVDLASFRSPCSYMTTEAQFRFH